MKTLAIIVNYHCWAMTLSAVESVLSSEALGSVRVVVVDNSEQPAEARALRQRLPEQVVLRVNRENVGFARACNGAYREFDAEAILLLNPDARLLSGGFLQLQQTLKHDPRVGAVAPQVHWDQARTFYLPPSYPPQLVHWQPLLNRFGNAWWLRSMVQGMWRRHAISVWKARHPVMVGNLSGGVVLISSSAIRNAGGLFDPRFFLYYEDMDLFVRLRRAGFRLLIEPRAAAVHLYDQCGRDRLDWKRGLMAEAHRLYVEKHCRTWPYGLLNLLIHHLPAGGHLAVARVPVSDKPFPMAVPIGLQDAWLFEWSPNPDFIPAMGHFGVGDHVFFDSPFNQLLAPGRYYGRLGKPSGGGRGARLVAWDVEGAPKKDAAIQNSGENG